MLFLLGFGLVFTMIRSKRRRTQLVEV